MNIRNKPALRDKLAAEYSLGTLKGAARRRFEGWLHNDADLRRLTAQWQARLMPLGEFASDVKPPQHVWRTIEQRLRLKPAMASVAPWRRWLSDSLDFWRNLGLVSTAMASVLVAVLLFKSLAPITPEIAYVATLTDEKSQAVMLVTADTAHRNMAVKFVLPQAVAADKSLELWAV
ncbi:MAG: anti-sigma factor, partial [Pseudomonadota bacterium]